MRQLFTTIVISSLAGILGAIIVLSAVPPRPDPFTGSMGRALRDEMLSRIEDLGQRVKKLEAR